MRKNPLITGLYYHIYNRGVDKRQIFMDKNDLERFIKSAKEFNTIKPIGSIKDLKLKKQEDSDVRRPNPLVSIVCYCFNPNHFHFILKQEVDGGISEFFKRLQGGYTKYFNLIHKRNGVLFQGSFKSKLIEKEDYLLKIWPYVHLNYMIHDIPKEKMQLVISSEKEYDAKNYNIVSKIEAEELLSFYGGNNNFKNECLNIVSIIKEERGIIPLSEEENLPFTDVERPE